MAELKIATPPEQIFKSAGFQMEPAKGVVKEMTAYVFDHMDFPEEGGMNAWFLECPFPAKGFPYPQAIFAANGAKKFFKVMLDMVSKDLWLIGVGFILTPRHTKIRIIERILDGYCEGAFQLIEPHRIKDDRYSPCPRELRLFISRFLRYVGINPQTAERFAEVFSLLIQYDDAYRYRIEDLLSETTKELLTKNPAKEIMRLVKIFEEREPQGTREHGNIGKFYHAAFVMKWLLLLPAFRRAFLGAIEESTFSNFQYDDADKYHCMLRSDYKHMGYSIEDRIMMYRAWCSTFNSFPPRPTIKLS